MKRVLTTAEEKAKWLANHRQLWQGRELSKEDRHQIAQLMKADGLYSPSTAVCDISTGLPKYIDMLKGVGQTKCPILAV